MRVVHLDHSSGWRGGQTQLMHLLDGSDDAVVCRTDSPLHRRLEAEKHPHTTHDDWLTPWGIAALSRTIQDLQPNLIAAHTSTAHGAGLRASSLPMVVHRRVDFKPSWSSRRKYERPTGFIAVSDAVANVLRGCGVQKRRILTVGDGVDTHAVEQAQAATDPQGWTGSSSRPCLLAVGALVDHKDHKTLLRSVARLPDVRLLLVGEGPLRGRLTRQARSLGIDNRVQILGQRNDVFGLLKSVDLFVHPSKLEGRGQAVIEALISGTPVVATHAGGLPETVGDGGLLVPPERPEDLAIAIRTALDGSENARSRARARGRQVRKWASLVNYRRQTRAAYQHFLSFTTHNDGGAIQGAGSDLNDA